MEKGSIGNYQISSVGKRLKAYIIDDLIVSILLLIIFYEQLITIYLEFKSSADIVPLVMFLEENTTVFILLRVIYQTFFVWQNGMTPGKMIVKIRVVDMQSGKIPLFRVAILRSTLRIISDSIFYIGYIVAYFNPLVQTLHDKLAKTVVVDA